MLAQSANLALRFLLELCVLAAVGYWGFKTHSGWMAKVVLGIGGPLLVAVIWGMFGAPKAAYLLHGLAFTLLEVVVFGSGVLALFVSGHRSLAKVFALVIIINRLLMYVWGQ